MSGSDALFNVKFPERLNTDVPVSKAVEADSPHIHNIITRHLPEQVVPRKGIPIIASWANATYGGDVWKEDTGWMPYAAYMGPDNQRILVGTVGAYNNNNGVRWTNYYGVSALLDGNNAAAFASLGIGYNDPTPHNLGYIEVDLVNKTYSQGTYKGITGLMTNWWGQSVIYDNCTLICTGADATKVHHDSKYWNAGHRWDIVPAIKTTPTVAPTIWSGQMSNIGGGGYPNISVQATSGDTKITMPSWAAGNELDGMMGWPVGTSTAPAPKYQYAYRVVKQDGTAAYLDRPYGLGESTTAVPNFSGNWNFTDFAPLSNAPLGVATLAVFRERVFGARGHISETIGTGAGTQNFPDTVDEYGGYYGNAIFWSKPGTFNKWPDTNFALVDTDAADPITAMIAVDEALLIFKASKMYALTGYDEDSFTIRNISNVVGCPYANGCTVFEGAVYFVASDGVYVYSDGSLRSLTSPDSAVGISSLWASQPWSPSYQRPTDQTHPQFEYYWPTIAVTPDGYLLVCVQDIEKGYDAASMAFNFVCDLQTGSWSTWGYVNPANNPMRVLQGSNGRVYGIHRSFVSELTDVWDPNSPLLDYDGIPEPINTNVTWAEAPDHYEDPIWVGVTWADGVPGITVTSSGVSAEFDMYIKPRKGQTTRVKEVQVDHGVYTLFGGKTSWTVGFDTDPDLADALGATVPNVHTIKARLKSSTVDPWAAYHFSDRFPETFQVEGQTIRVSFRLVTDTHPSEAIQSYRLYDFFMLGTSVRNLGVDNTPTS